MAAVGMLSFLLLEQYHISAGLQMKCPHKSCIQNRVHGCCQIFRKYVGILQHASFVWPDYYAYIIICTRSDAVYVVSGFLSVISLILQLVCAKVQSTMQLVLKRTLSMAKGQYS